MGKSYIQKDNLLSSFKKIEAFFIVGGFFLIFQGCSLKVSGL